MPSVPGRNRSDLAFLTFSREMSCLTASACLCEMFSVRWLNREAPVANWWISRLARYSSNNQAQQEAKRMLRVDRKLGVTHHSGIGRQLLRSQLQPRDRRGDARR